MDKILEQLHDLWYYSTIRYKWCDAKLWLQRKIRGWSDDEVWNLDEWFLESTLIRLKEYRKTLHSCPGQLCGNEDGTERPFEEALAEWEEILDTMIGGMEYGVGENDWWDEENGCALEEDERIRRTEKFNEAMQLFAKWVKALWN